MDLMPGTALKMSEGLKELLGAATTWPAFSMDRALLPQLLKLVEALDETVKAGTTIQEALKPAILLRCVSRQLKPELNLTLGDNVQYSTLREQVLQWDRSQQKWATSMVASTWWLGFTCGTCNLVEALFGLKQFASST